MPDDFEPSVEQTDPDRDHGGHEDPKMESAPAVRRGRGTASSDVPERRRSLPTWWRLSPRSTLIAAGVVVIVVVALVVLAMNRSEPEVIKKPTTTTQPPVVTQLSANYTIGNLLPRDGQYSEFLALAKSSGVLKTLEKDDEITAFIPDTAAWKDTEAAVDKESPEQVTQLLRRHLVAGSLQLRDILKLDGKSVKNLDGQELPVVVDGTTVTVGGAKIAKSNIQASNGVIFVIESVIAAPG